MNIQKSICLLSTLFLIACGEEDAPQKSTTDNTAVNSYLLATKPADPLEVGKAREAAIPGETIVVTGRVGGTRNPIAQKYASFVLLDSAITMCHEMGDDHYCPTPWDACCEDPENLAASRTSILFYQENGQPVEFDLKRQANLNETDTVTVTGTVAENSTPDNLLIIADGIYIEPNP